jgi:hypothetical protein
MELRMIDEAMICAANNVDWYQAIFRSHGLTGEIIDGIWISRDAAPPYYSNAVTLAPSGQQAQVARLRELGGLLRGQWSVKDSFATLDLSSLGFRPLFDAEWIWCDASDAPARDSGGITWRPVTTTAQLERWEAAWRKSGSPTETPVFVPNLLADPKISLFGGYRGDTVVAGCAGNRSADAVGFSNFFLANGEEPLAVAGAIAEVARFGAGLPIVGYLAGERLAEVSGLGFRSVGLLRIWVTDAR